MDVTARYIMLHCIILYHIILYYIILHYIEICNIYFKFHRTMSNINAAPIKFILQMKIRPENSTEKEPDRKPPLEIFMSFVNLHKQVILSLILSILVLIVIFTNRDFILIKMRTRLAVQVNTHLHPIVAYNCQYNRYNNLWPSYIWRCRVGEHQACIHIAYVLYVLICIHTTDIRPVYARKLLRTPLWRCAARGIQESWIRISPEEISLRCREPATKILNKPNSEQFSLLLDTLENSSPRERVRLCIELLGIGFTRANFFTATAP